jgi:hypothetical protein
MNKLDALKAIAEGINALIDLETGNAIPVSEEPKQEDEPKKKSKVTVLAEKKAEKKVEEKKEEVDVDSMDYRQLKSYASEIGVKAKGTKGQLLKAVKDFLANGGEEVSEEEEKPARGVVSMKAKKAEEVEKEVESEEEDDDSEDENTTIKEVESAIKEQELTDDDLRDILKDLGLSTKGGHEVLVSKLADAVDAGELSLDDDEVEDEAEETESEEEDVTDDENAEEDAEESDNEENNEENEITAERKQAIDDFTAETTEAFENEEISVEDMRDFIKDFGEKISKKASDEEVLAKYIECASMLIDDEGNTVEEGAYMLNGVPFCCGHALEISEDGTSGKCSICGEEYEFEE